MTNHIHTDELRGGPTFVKKPWQATEAEADPEFPDKLWIVYNPNAADSHRWQIVFDKEKGETICRDLAVSLRQERYHPPYLVEATLDNWRAFKVEIVITEQKRDPE